MLRNPQPPDRLVSRPQGRQVMAPKNSTPDPSMDGAKQVPARPHDSGSAANETVDGLDATTEALRHAAEDTPSGTGPGDIDKIPVFDQAGACTENFGGGCHGNQKARYNRRNGNRGAPSCAGAADHQYLSRRIDPWRYLVRVFPSLMEPPATRRDCPERHSGGGHGPMARHFSRETGRR
jgi:hypothetical protein